MFQNPQNKAQGPDGITPLPPGTTGANIMNDVEAQEHYDTFFEDVFLELEEKYGEIEEMNVSMPFYTSHFVNVFINLYQCCVLDMREFMQHYDSI